MIKDDVCLVAGNLLFVADGFSQSLRKDLIDSVLFSQLYANTKIGKLADAESWYVECATGMEKVKWRRTDYKSNSFEPGNKAGFIIKDSVVSRVRTIFGTSQSERFEHLINCAEHSFVDDAVGVALREHTVATIKLSDDSDYSTVVLQVGVLGVGPVLHSVFICFSTTEDVEVDFLNQCFSGKHIVGEVSLDFARQLFSQADFGKRRIREKIIDQLPDSRDELVLELCPGCIG